MTTNNPSAPLVEDLKTCKTKPKTGVENEYATGPNAIRQPALHFIVGQRVSGKSYLASQMLADAMKDKTFDVVYMITPSFASNRAYFERYVKNENVYEPTKDSIAKVIKRVEDDRDEWMDFMNKKRKIGRHSYDSLMKLMMKKNDPLIWKYKTEQPPRSLLILDDVISSPAILASSGLGQIATLNRHIGPMPETFDGRSACGLGVWILCQTYRMQSGIGRVLRENVSALTLFKNRQQKQREAILEELGSVVDENLIDNAWTYCCEKDHGNLTIDFRPKRKELTLRQNMQTALIYDHPDCIT